MKTLYILISFTMSLMISSQPLLAQNQIAVPLSKPGQPGWLEMSFIMADVTVSAYDGSEVVIRYAGDNVRENDSSRNSSRDGLRRIGGSGTGFEVTENNNRVVLDGGFPRGMIQFEILVPRNFSLNISVVTGPGIKVEGVNGNHEINHVNGEIRLVNVSGSALINTVNGNIKADFASVTPDKPMAFSNVNGDIDVTLPANTRFTAKMRSEFGEMFTDFDLKMQAGAGPTVNRNNSRFKAEVNNWVIGDANGGGPEFMFKTLRGDFYLRKK